MLNGYNCTVVCHSLEKDVVSPCVDWIAWLLCCMIIAFVCCCSTIRSHQKWCWCTLALLSSCFCAHIHLVIVWALPAELPWFIYSTIEKILSLNIIFEEFSCVSLITSQPPRSRKNSPSRLTPRKRCFLKREFRTLTNAAMLWNS